MKKNTKGFTLIELLAVIVILAIIALIATPIVLSLINKAREGAAKDSAYGVKEAAKYYYAVANVTSTTDFTATNVTFGSTTGGTLYSTITDFSLDGTAPSSGYVTISSTGDMTGCLVISSYNCAFGTKGEVTCAETGTGVVADTTTGRPACSGATIASVPGTGA